MTPFNCLELDGLAFGHHDDFAARAFHGFYKFSRGAFGQGVGAVVDGDDHFGGNPVFHAESCIFGVHGEIATDRDEHQVGLVTVVNEFHVTEQSCITHVPNFETILHLNDVTH
ncbi:MAG: hypothetical protein RL103_2048, partial [Pseudomonadota bacterium]